MEFMNPDLQSPVSGTADQSSCHETAAEGNSHLVPRQETAPQRHCSGPSKQQESQGDAVNKQAAITAQPVLGKENRLSRPSLVQGLAEWEFPGEIGDKSTFLNASLQQGIDATPHELSSLPPKERTVPQGGIRTPRPTRGKRKRYDEKTLEANVIGFQDKRESILFSSPQSRGKRGHNEDEFFEKTIVPKAFNVEFDQRFIDYAIAPDGTKMKEKFMWSFGKKDPALSLTLSGARMETVPDLPKRIKKGLSRVGPMYQARIPEWGKSGNEYETPGYDKVWDPQKAEEAERQGQDITGYLAVIESKCLDLYKADLLMKILHENDYSVECAINDIRKVQLFRTPFKLIQHRELEDDWCSFLEVNVRDPKTGKAAKKCKFQNVENDITIICDGCGRNYHQECLGYESVPPGRWFCPICTDHLDGLFIGATAGAPKTTES